MSSILDALERADQERRRDQQTPVGEVSAHTRSSWKPRGFWILVSILLLANLTLWTLVWRRDMQADVGDIQQAARESANPPSRISATPAPVATQEVESQGIVASSSSASIEEELKRRARPGSGSLLAAARVSPPTPSVQAFPTPAVAKSTSPPDSRVKRRPDTGSGIAPSIVEPEPLIEPPVKATPQPNTRVVLDEPASLESTSVSSPAAILEPEPSEWQMVPTIWEVPRSVRTRLEGLKVSVHLYHSEPGRRFVIINKHRYGEEDVLDNTGLRLKRITPEGVIIDYGDGEVRM